MSILNPFQLLELNVISAQDLAPVSRSMRTYAVAWVHPDRKLSTRVDTHGHNNPTWNDKFVFRVDDEFLHADTSAVMIEIYALHWFKDIHVGTVRILVGNLIPTPPRLHHFSQQPQVGMRFVALQVRRPSGRPQGILNIGVALLHSSMRSMPLYSQLSTSAIGYRNLMGEEDPFNNHHNNHSHGTPTVTTTKLEMRRSKSDTSSMMIGSELRGSEMMGKGTGTKSKASSMINGSEVSKQKKKGRSKASSMISGSVVIKRKGKSRKASSMISGSGLEETNKNGRNGIQSSIIGTTKKDKTDKSSTISSSEVYPIEPPPAKVTEKEKPVPKPDYLDSPKRKVSQEKPNSNAEIFDSPPWKKPQEKPIAKPEFIDSPRRKAAQETPNRMVYATPLRTPQRGGGTARATPMHEKYGTPRRTTPLHGKSYTKFNEFTYATPRKSFLGGALLTESELGPSPSEVAAQMANQKVDDGNESSIIGGLSLNDSVEGLQSKLERWRTELPPLYDRGELSSFPSSETRHARRHSDGGGLFSCFSNICGCECSIVCGGGSAKGQKKSASGRVIRSPSADNASFV